MKIEIQRKIVIATDAENAKDYANRGCNVVAQGYPSITIDTKVIKVLPQELSRFEELRRDEEEVK